MKGATKILIAAKDKLENVGWVQGQSQRYDWDTNKVIGYCALGAINVATDQLLYSRKGKAINQAVDCLQKAIGGAKYSVVAYNDNIDRTKQEVLEAFDKAIQCAQ